MNESIFLLQILMIVLFSFGALKLGKEALIALVGLQALMANLFVLKQVAFLGFHVTCSDAFAIGSILCLNLLREYYGKESSQKALKICFFILLFFVLLSEVHLLYRPTAQDTAHAAYHAILSSSPRLLLVSLATFFLVQKLDLSLFQLFKRAPLTFRSHFSLIVCQLVDTLFFSFFGLYGLVESISDIIILSFLIKLLIIFCLTPITLFSRKLISNDAV
ncbi:MAG TPA: queuosine precursor transporter [Rhabdochlamydiaceae bacterium]|nr:queuosine precursor transporter [Rhabdochlamydiaceae bacterium]